jgi:nucleotide-binding universal stress UspA family protein
MDGSTLAAARAGGRGFIRRILVPLDGSPLAERAVPHALAVARAFGARLLMMRVVGNKAAEALEGPEWRLQHLEAERYIEELAARLRAAGTDAEGRTAVGRASEQIVSMARAEGIDLIVLGSHGAGGLTSFHHSGTAAKVLSSAGCSVMLVTAAVDPGPVDEPVRYERILVPVDGSMRSDWAASLAAAIAQAAAGEIVLMHVVRCPEVVGRQGRDTEANRLAQRLMELNAAAARRHLEGRQAAFVKSRTCPVRIRIEQDTQVGPVIDRVARDEAASLIVVSAHGQTPSTLWPFGTVVGSLLSFGATSILVLQDQPQQRSGGARAGWAAARERRVPIGS